MARPFSLAGRPIALNPNTTSKQEGGDSMQNPFDDEESLFHVVLNAEGQHALWPVFADVPAGWEVVLRERNRRDCLDHIERNWTDIRPLSLTRE